MLNSQVLFPQFLLYCYSYTITREEVKDENNRVSVSPFRVNNAAQQQQPQTSVKHVRSSPALLRF